MAVAVVLEAAAVARILEEASGAAAPVLEAVSAAERDTVSEAASAGSVRELAVDAHLAGSVPAPLVRARAAPAALVRPVPAADGRPVVSSAPLAGSDAVTSEGSEVRGRPDVPASGSRFPVRIS